MASVKLKHTDGNGTILHSPAANPSADVTLKLPSTTGSAGQVLKVASANHSATNAELEFAAAGGGKVLQVLQTVKSDTFSESVATGQPSSVVTGLTVTITASSASNKILLLYQTVTGQQVTYHQIDKDGSTLTTAIGDASGNRSRVTAMGDYTHGTYFSNTLPMIFLDTAGDTNAHTYGVRLRHSSSGTQTVTVNGQETTNDNTVGRSISTITAMEIAA